LGLDKKNKSGGGKGRVCRAKRGIPAPVRSPPYRNPRKRTEPTFTTKSRLGKRPSTAAGLLGGQGRGATPITAVIGLPPYFRGNCPKTIKGRLSKGFAFTHVALLLPSLELPVLSGPSILGPIYSVPCFPNIGIYLQPNPRKHLLPAFPAPEKRGWLFSGARGIKAYRTRPKLAYEKY